MSGTCTVAATSSFVSSFRKGKKVTGNNGGESVFGQNVWRRGSTRHRFNDDISNTERWRKDPCCSLLAATNSLSLLKDNRITYTHTHTEKRKLLSVLPRSNLALTVHTSHGHECHLQFYWFQFPPRVFVFFPLSENVQIGSIGDSKS